MKHTYHCLVLLLVILFASCIPHRSFVATSFNPVLTEKKGDLQVNCNARPFKFAKLDATYAVSNHLAIRAGYSGFFGLDNVDASLIMFGNYKRKGLFVAGNINYQHNTIHRSFSLEMWGRGREYKYNCEYISPGIVAGIKLYGKETRTHHLMFKASYNLVKTYQYHWFADNASGKQQGYAVGDNETLNYPLRNFFSFEPMYAYTAKQSKNMAIQLQLGLSFCQKVLEHDYYFETRKYYSETPYSKATQLHPTTLFLNFSIGFCISSNLAGVKKE